MLLAGFAAADSSALGLAGAFNLKDSARVIRVGIEVKLGIAEVSGSVVVSGVLSRLA